MSHLVLCRSHGVDCFNTTMQSKHRSASCIVLRSQNSDGAIQPRYQDCPSDRHSAKNIADQLLSVSESGDRFPMWSYMRLVCRENTRCIASKDAAFGICWAAMSAGLVCCQQRCRPRCFTDLSLSGGSLPPSAFLVPRLPPRLLIIRKA